MEEKRECISIDSNLDDVRIVGKKVREICETLDFSNVTPGDVELALVESINNCIKHAYNFESGNRVDVEMVVNGDKLNLHIRDSGKPMSKELRDRYNQPNTTNVSMPAHEVAVDALPVSGWGVALVRTICDEVKYYREDNLNRLSLSFSLID